MASAPRDPAEAEWPLRPSLRSHTVSFLAYSVGEGSPKAIWIQGKEEMTKIQNALFRSSQQGLH